MPSGVPPPGARNYVGSYALIMGVYAPSNSIARAGFFNIFDRWGNLMRLESNPGAAGEVLSVSGRVDDRSFYLEPILPPGAWSRIALVVDNTGCRNGGSDPNTACGDSITLSLYLDGKPAGSTSFAAPTGALAFSPDSLATVLSSPGATTRESYVSSLQFRTISMTPEMIAGIGGCDNGPLPANDTSVGVPPVLSISIANGVVNLPWMGSAFLLQETSDLSSGVWVDSMPPFDQMEVNGDIRTISHAEPPLPGPTRFYRLIYVP